MKCCCCGNNFRGLIKKEGTKVSEEGICPVCKLSVGEYHFISIYGRRVVSRCVFTGTKKQEAIITNKNE